MATVLRLTGLHSRFELFATVPEAIGAFAHPGLREADMSKPGASWAGQHPLGELHVTAAAGGQGPPRVPVG